uniref:Uncharacterized protein n=1 Tax=Arundo donax TaxID=35708 RepID=A0A0A8YWC9_ARUDO
MASTALSTAPNPTQVSTRISLPFCCCSRALALMHGVLGCSCKPCVSSVKTTSGR